MHQKASKLLGEKGESRREELNLCSEKKKDGGGEPLENNNIFNEKIYRDQALGVSIRMPLTIKRTQQEILCEQKGEDRVVMCKPHKTKKARIGDKNTAGERAKVICMGDNKPRHRTGLKKLVS